MNREGCVQHLLATNGEIGVFVVHSTCGHTWVTLSVQVDICCAGARDAHHAILSQEATVTYPSVIR